MIIYRDYVEIKKDLKRLYRKLNKKYSEQFQGMNCTETGVEFHFQDETIIDELHFDGLWNESDQGIIHKCMKSLGLTE